MPLTERLRHYFHHGLHRPSLVAGDDKGRLVVRGGKVLLWEGGKHFLNFLQSDLLREMDEPFRQNLNQPLPVLRY